MSTLLEFQRSLAAAVMQPINASGELSRAGARQSQDAIALVKPNSRLTSQERLEIYCRSYWARLLDSLAADFPGVRGVVGVAAFDHLRRDYLTECPSRSWTLRNLGQFLPGWIERNSERFGARHRIALDMARLEWAQIESFDWAEHPPLSPSAMAELDGESTLRLQPHLQLVEAAYEVDSLLLEIRDGLERRGGKPRSLTEKRILRAHSQAPVYLAIHRSDLVVHFKQLDREMFRLLEAISQGKPLEATIESAYEGTALDEVLCRQHVEQSFALFAALGWFCGEDRKAS
jgi:hypothetical protein